MLSTFSRSVLRSVSNQCNRQFSLSSASNVRTGRQIPQSSVAKPLSNIQEDQNDKSEEDIAKTKEILSKVNEQIVNKDYGRLFAIVGVDINQWKITEGDLLMLLRETGASLGQRIRLEKVLLVGSKDFSLIGRPLLPRDLINVEATVVEKSLGHKKVHHYKAPGTRSRHTKWMRDTTTTLRINKIELLK